MDSLTFFKEFTRILKCKKIEFNLLAFDVFYCISCYFNNQACNLFILINDVNVPFCIKSKNVFKDQVDAFVKSLEKNCQNESFILNLYVEHKNVILCKNPKSLEDILIQAELNMA